jgi:hypothetical protein
MVSTVRQDGNEGSETDVTLQRLSALSSERYLIVAAVALAVAVSLAAIDGRSFWIDEASIWAVAQWPNLGQWWSALMANPSADAQEPAFQFYVYVWTSVFGDSERVMRLANFPWFAIGCAAIAAAPLSVRLRVIWLLIIAASPFNWYYLNEARPYMLFFAGAALICVAWVGLVSAAVSGRTLSGPDVVRYACGCVLLLSGTILGAVWIASSALVIGISLRHRIGEALHLVAKNWLLISACAAVSLAIAAIAGLSFLNGGRASTVGGFSLTAIGYGILELEGAAGFGPGRNDLRVGLADLPHGELLALLCFGAIALVFVLSALRRLDRSVAFAAIVTCAIPLAFMIAASGLLGWRVVGRHMLPLLMPISLAYASETSRLLRGNGFQKAAAAAFVAALVASTAMIRFAERHAKDDYAAAAKYVRPLLEQSKVVLWAADTSGAAYYRLIPIGTIEQRYDDGGLVFDLPSDEQADVHRRKPDAIAYSKPDIYDPTGRIMHYIRARGMTKVASFPAFAIYAMPESR